MNNRLTVSGNAPDRIYKLLLVVMLVISQFALALHKVDFAHHAHGKKCAICLAAHALDHPLPAGFTPPVVPNSHVVPVTRPPRFTVRRTPVRLVARSPPIPALHA